MSASKYYGGFFDMSRHEIEKILSDIFKTRFSMNYQDNPSKKDAKLLGKNGIPARELLHLYFDVKRDFGIVIPEDDIVDGRFDTFNHIIEIIDEQLSKQAV